MSSFQILGGLALFIFGLGLMSEGLQQTAAGKLRAVLARATRNRVQGLALGTFLGLLMHSSAATLLYVGFVNAGLISVFKAVPLVFGANVGTSLSMQLVSFRLSEYCFIPIAVGLLLRLAGPAPWFRHAGTSLLGFGLLFLGMSVMSDAIRPFRDQVGPWLTRIDGATLGGMIAGIVLAALLTALIQSSGAMIGMAFVLIESGVFTHLTQVYPLIIGAQIGTCTTALIASLGTNVNARRCAMSHLTFNVLNAALAVVAAPLFLRLLPLTAGDLVHQAANLHTLSMAAGALLFLPVVGPFTRLVERLVPTRQPLPEPSYLDRDLLDRPEQAIAAVFRELQRMARVAVVSLRLSRQYFFKSDRRILRRVRLNEAVINRIKRETIDYLVSLTDRYLSRRQTLLIENLLQSVNHLERIGDHIELLSDISQRRHRLAQATFEHDTLEKFNAVFVQTETILHLLVDALATDNGTGPQRADDIVNARQELGERIASLEALYRDKLAAHAIPPIRGILLHQYTSTTQRLSNHAQNIAAYVKKSDFHLKPSKLNQIAGDAEAFAPLPPEDAVEFLQDEPPDD